MKEFIYHIGFPKTGSTSLQLAFSQSTSNYLGFYPKLSTDGFYKHREVGNFLEQVVRFGTEKAYLDSYKAVEELLSLERDSFQGITILSNENIIGRFTPYDLPNDIKLSRALSVVPLNTKMLIGIRKLESLFLSLYKLLVSNGYGEKPEYFLKEIDSLNPVFGFLDSFDLELICDFIKNLRPDVEIFIYNIEDANSIINTLRELNLDIEIKKENTSFKLSDVSYHLNLNKSFYSGKRYLDWLEVHRVFPDDDYEDCTKYRLSRSRHLHNVSGNLNFFDKNSLIDDLFYELIPDSINEISVKNQIFYHNYLALK